MSDTLSKQLEEYRAGWMQRVPADRRAIMERHIAHLTKTEFAQRAKQVGDQAPTIILPDVHGKTFRYRNPISKRARRGDLLPRRLVPLLQSRAEGLPSRPAAHRRCGREPGRNQPRDAGRYRQHCREERADLSGAE